ncbi:MAG: hypothetical protein U0031_14365 [Thermomicrobiales bacterium]
MPESETFPEPTALGFAADGDQGWLKTIRGRTFRFQILQTLGDLASAEELQESAYGISERDLVSANELVVVKETGGAVLGVFAADESGPALGAVIGWGGFVGHPRLVSDFMAVRAEARNFGLATELKRLQAAIAWKAGFEEIVWTVDPLLAANARLNFGKLGAISRHYEIDRYGSWFATDRYGGMPSDRLHLSWEITRPEVVARIVNPSAYQADPAWSTLSKYCAGSKERAVQIAIPADIDALVQADPGAAYAYRMRLRDHLPRAFDEGFVVCGFIPAEGERDPSLLLRHLPAD